MITRDHPPEESGRGRASPYDLSQGDEAITDVPVDVAVTLISARADKRESRLPEDDARTKLRHPVVEKDVAAGGSSDTRAVASLPGAGTEADCGTILCGRYRLDELLGQGGMGMVFRATDLQMPGVQVAIKLLKPEFRTQPELLNILRESVRKVRSLPHPSIAGVYSLDSDGRNDFVIMELLQGTTLQALLDGEYARGLPIEMARALIADLCSALAYAHDHSVIHSDIKPSNIFVTPSGHAKLFDFDIARVLRGPVGYFDAHQVGAITLAYSSVEMAQGDRPDPRDDVYALACVIYEMLSGAHPFGGVSALEARDKGLQVKPLPGLRRAENNALSQALRFNRQDRLPRVEALQSAFAGRRRAWRPVVSLRHPALVAGGIGLAVVLGAVLTWWAVRSPPVPSGKQQLTTRAAAELNRAKTLAARAAQLAVDGRDETLRHGISLLDSVRGSSDPERILNAAQAASAALTAAIVHSPRIARLGTTDPQLQQALQLCRQSGLRSQHCSAGDLADEAPRSVSLPPFAIDAAPVANEAFARFVEATGRRTLAETKGLLYAPDPTRGWDNALRGENWRTLREAAAAHGEAADARPVLGMDLESARAFCKWKGKRLPTEDEWEYSVRGPSGHVFSWGDQAEVPTAAGASGGAQSVSGSGNAPELRVAEWVETRVEGQRVLRGGSWLLPQPYFQRLALRRLAPPGAVMDAGFRCAWSVESWPGI